MTGHGFRRSPASRGSGSKWLWMMAAMLGIASWGAWWWSVASAPHTRDELRPPPTPADVDGPPDAAVRSTPAGSGSALPPSSSCAPRTHKACKEGDVWWFDDCGLAETKAQECGDQLCEAGACQQAIEGECPAFEVPARCDGDRIHGCLAGHRFERDCAAVGKVCVTDEEGARCVERPSAPCAPDAKPYCSEEDTLVVCQAGGWVEIDCPAMGGACDETAANGQARCVEIIAHDATLVLDLACGPCGCDPLENLATCEGEDTDGDGLVDDSHPCGPLPLVAYVITREGRSSYEPSDFEAERLRIEAAFSNLEGHFGTGAEWLDIVTLERPQWSMLEDADIGALSREVAGLGQQFGFHIPVVFTDRIESGEVPAAGIATLPNARCGGVRRNFAPQPPYGIVAVAKGRSPTTVAHEIGHYLGLCHTHAEMVEAVRAMVVTDRGTQTCREACELEGDGICDTPPDPGLEVCAYTESCDVLCQSPAVPDPTNIMSYYTACRSRFTTEQAREMRRGLELRRGWFACLGPNGCPCTPLQNACPRDMSCRPTAHEWRCTLDGPVAPGQACEHQAACRDGGLCLTVAGRQRCVRPCVASSASCTCEARGGVSFRVCTNDL